MIMGIYGMTLPSFGHQARVMALGYMIEGKEVSSRDNLFISVDIYE
jgi:hypothetical protein